MIIAARLIATIKVITTTILVAIHALVTTTVTKCFVILIYELATRELSISQRSLTT